MSNRILLVLVGRGRCLPCRHLTRGRSPAFKLMMTMMKLMMMRRRRRRVMNDDDDDNDDGYGEDGDDE